MNKLIALALMAILTLNTAISEESEEKLTQSIRGRVVDMDSKTPLIGATVVLMESDPPKGTITNQNGEFELTGVPIGRRSIKVTYVGYNEAHVNNVLLSSGKQLVLNIELEEKVVAMDEVVVKAHSRKDRPINDMAMISARSFTVEETERFAGSLGDPSRMVANYAGVMTQNDSRNDIIIRGNSPSGLLWRVEGVEIPNPNHFGALGTTGGPISMLNNNLLTNSDFLTGAFPAEYGNATAGAFDLNLRSGNNQQYEYVGQIGFNGFEAGIEGPFSENSQGSFLANYRYSTLAVMHEIGFGTGTGTAVPYYQDFTFNIDLPGTKYGRFKLFGLGGLSHIELGRNVEDQGNSYNARGTATDYGSDMGVVGLTHLYFFNNNTRVLSTLSAQGTKSYTRFDSLLVENNLDPKAVYRSDLGEAKYSFSSKLKSKLNARNNWSMGTIIDFYDMNYVDSAYVSKFNSFITQTNHDGNLMLYRLFGQWKHKFTEKLSVYGGLNLQHMNLNSEVAIEPRAGISWEFARNQSVSLGYGRHSQMQARNVYFKEYYDSVNNRYLRTNEDLKFTRSDHYILGYDWLINNDFRIKAETYFQDLYNVPVSREMPEYSLINTGDFFGVQGLDSMVNKGTGTNYGIELTIEKFLSKGYYFLFTSSLFDSKYTDYNGIERNTAFNGNYVFNLLGGYEFKIGDNNLLTLDMKTVWAGGKRYVPLDMDETIKQGSAEYDWDNAYQEKHDDYFRLDFRIGFKLNKGAYTQEWGVDLQNMTNYQSVFRRDYDPIEQEVYNTYQMGFMPMVLYRIQF